MKITVKEDLSLEDFYNIVFKESKVELDPKFLERVESSFDFLKEFSANKVIYGVNTGFGPMAQYKIDEKDTIQLQYNLIRSHSSGTSNPLTKKYVKAAMLARLIP